jgi:hypothetical protein
VSQGMEKQLPARKGVSQGQLELGQIRGLGRERLLHLF